MVWALGALRVFHKPCTHSFFNECQNKFSFDSVLNMQF